MKGISTQIGLTNSNPMQLGATAPKFGNHRVMRDAHLARSCVGGLKLRFVRRYMAAQGLRPSPTDWEGCFAAWENWEWGVKKFRCLSQAPWKFLGPSFPKISLPRRGSANKQRLSLERVGDIALCPSLAPTRSTCSTRLKLSKLDFSHISASGGLMAIWATD